MTIHTRTGIIQMSVSFPAHITCLCKGARAQHALAGVHSMIKKGRVSLESSVVGHQEIHVI